RGLARAAGRRRGPKPDGAARLVPAGGRLAGGHLSIGRARGVFGRRLRARPCARAPVQPRLAAVPRRRGARPRPQRLRRILLAPRRLSTVLKGSNVHRTLLLLSASCLAVSTASAEVFVDL